jgi:hypothetical protein
MATKAMPRGATAFRSSMANPIPVPLGNCRPHPAFSATRSSAFSQSALALSSNESGLARETRAPPVLDWILSGGARHLFNEAFEIENVGVGAGRPPWGAAQLHSADHAGRSYIDAVNGLNAGFELNVEAPHAAADQGVLVGGLDRRLLVQLDRGRLCGDLTVAERSSRRLMSKHTIFGCYLRDRHAPLLRRRRLQPLARARARLLIEHTPEPYRAARLGVEVVINVVFADMAVGVTPYSKYRAIF